MLLAALPHLLALANALTPVTTACDSGWHDPVPDFNENGAPLLQRWPVIYADQIVGLWPNPFMGGNSSTDCVFPTCCKFAECSTLSYRAANGSDSNKGKGKDVKASGQDKKQEGGRKGEQGGQQGGDKGTGDTGEGAEDDTGGDKDDEDGEDESGSDASGFSNDSDFNLGRCCDIFCQACAGSAAFKYCANEKDCDLAPEGFNHCCDEVVGEGAWGCINLPKAEERRPGSGLSCPPSPLPNTKARDTYAGGSLSTWRCAGDKRIPVPTLLGAPSRRYGRGLDDKTSAPEIWFFLHPGYDAAARLSAPQGTLVQVWESHIKLYYKHYPCVAARSNPVIEFVYFPHVPLRRCRKPETPDEEAPDPFLLFSSLRHHCNSPHNLNEAIEIIQELTELLA
ncbi:hypothetical protein B0T14DRAFT_567942 [Immersiella caudata]|uniref:Uncharacterized protein n=1 Tax=Immersiella caudata TaxID=314043 RepID=A0AA39WJ95_9PEZI|nr:hypothetical protein B0T14DRAFT_567942 [Immersiella caudata]